MEIDLEDLKKIKELGKRVEGIITNELNDIFEAKQMLESFFMVIDSMIASYYLKIISTFKKLSAFKDIEAAVSLFDKTMLEEFDNIRHNLRDKMHATRSMIIDENPEAMINALKEFKELDPKNGDEIDELISEFKKL